MVLGLWASLVPHITYTHVSSGAADGDVLIAWPGWSIQQPLGPLRGTVGTFRIWVSADPTAFRDVTLQASLIDAATREVLRQTLITASRRYIPAAHTVAFPRYAVPEGQRLMLQFGVPVTQKHHVIYRLAHRDPSQDSIMLNGVPDAANGPLAYAHLKTGSGLRAALDGEASSRWRGALGLAAGVLALLAHLRIGGPLRRATGSVGRGARHLANRVRRSATPDVGRTPSGRPSCVKRVLAVPWYPWPAVAVPILHYLTSNRLHFVGSDVLVTLAVALATVTIIVVGLRVGLKDWHRAAAVCTVLVVGFFGYGHVVGVLEGRLDERLLFALAVVLSATLAGLIVRHGAGASHTTAFLNLVAAMLVVFPMASLAIAAVVGQHERASTPSHDVTNLAAHLLPEGVPSVRGPRPDIYYIVLDAYSRHDALRDLYGFDNADFLAELERRGFYVAREATSNYGRSIQSIPSTLNLAYLHELGDRVPASQADLINLAQAHALGAILRELGYKYIHLASGHTLTNTSPLADQVVSFAPSGPQVRSGDHAQMTDVGTPHGHTLSNRFLRSLLQTTALAALLPPGSVLGQDSPYEWHSSQRSLAMFRYLARRPESVRPTFVFAHMLKPHLPATFDQYGNQLESGFDDAHDPRLLNAYIGQLIYVNTLVVNLVDALLQGDRAPPVIVIAADHGHIDDRHLDHVVPADRIHDVLLALHLPHGGSEGLDASLSSVNTFRYVLDYYFGLDLGLVPAASFAVADSVQDLGIRPGDRVRGAYAADGKIEATHAAGGQKIAD